MQTTIRPRPFIKWAGGKTALLEELCSRMPTDFNTYFEPFLGAGALFFEIESKKAVVNDLNKKLITTYSVIRNHLEELKYELSQLAEKYLGLEDLTAKENFFKQVRTQFNSSEIDDIQVATFFIFLNKTCFNGLYRENSRGEFNVPFGKRKAPSFFDEKSLTSASELLQNTTILQGNYLKATQTAKEGDFVYFDPPYAPLTVSASFTAYQADGFSEIDQKILRDEFARLAGIGAYVMASNSDTPLINELYGDFKIHKITAPRRISALNNGRASVSELIITNY